ncbi:MAG: glycosyltransferase family 2 protein [Vicingus serpentipes]|nr:glycosyltransferase family 2 protein [Vicingus serpentipes]
MMLKNKLNSLSVVVSVFNEEASLNNLWRELYTVLSGIHDVSFEIVFVNDGSKDNSLSVIQSIVEDNQFSKFEFITINFSRNFGHEAAMIAGIDSSKNEAVVCLDADLQHPPKLIPAMIQEYNNGYEIVNTTRIKRMDNGMVKNMFSKFFYKLLNTLSEYSFEKNSSDFFLISRRVADLLKNNFREHNRFLRGYIQTIGFTKTSIPFEAPARADGKSSYSLSNLIKLSFIAIFTFSNKPLRIALFISLFFIFFTTSISVYSLFIFFFGETPPSGYTTLIIFQSVCFTIIFLLIGILSIYFGKSLNEIRQRPIYIIESLSKKNTK